MLYTTNSFVPYNCLLREARVVFLGIPFSGTSVGETSQYGPIMVREGLKMKEDWSSENKVNLFDKICDIGDVEVVHGSYELTGERIKHTIKEIRQENPNAFLIFVGGEHIITLPIVEELKPKTIIQFDAHTDLRSDFMGCRFSHATWAFHAKKNLDCELMQIGTRSWSKQEEENKKIARQMSIEDISELLNSGQGLKEPVYVTIDVDVFDPVYVKTGLPEPKGLDPEQVFCMLDKIFAYNIVGLDLVEIADRTLPSRTGLLCADVIKRAISNLIHKTGKRRNTKRKRKMLFNQRAAHTRPINHLQGLL